MSRIRNFAGLAAVVLLVGTASLAQAQGTGSYWNGSVSGDWGNAANWTTASGSFAGNPSWYSAPASSTMAEL